MDMKMFNSAWNTITGLALLALVAAFTNHFIMGNKVAAQGVAMPRLYINGQEMKPDETGKINVHIIVSDKVGTVSIGGDNVIIIGQPVQEK